MTTKELKEQSEIPGTVKLKEYTTPQLAIFGDFQVLTTGTGGPYDDSGLSSSMIKT